MRKIIASIIILAVLLMASTLYAAGTVTITGQWLSMDQTRYEVTIAWTGDASSGSVPDTAFPSSVMSVITSKGLFAGCAETKPGTKTPTADYDITIVNTTGIDIYGGALTNRSATAPQQTYPKLIASGIWGTRPVNNTLTFKLANNSIASATGIVKLIFDK